MLVHQAYRFELDLANAARAALASHCGAGRFAYNFGLALVTAKLEASSKPSLSARARA